MDDLVARIGKQAAQWGPCFTLIALALVCIFAKDFIIQGLRYIAITAHIWVVRQGGSDKLLKEPNALWFVVVVVVVFVFCEVSMAVIARYE